MAAQPLSDVLKYTVMEANGSQNVSQVCGSSQKTRSAKVVTDGCGIRTSRDHQLVHDGFKLRNAVLQEASGDSFLQCMNVAAQNQQLATISRNLLNKEKGQIYFCIF